jgi:transcriptional regulator with XRE-family HTH domain
MLDTEWATLTEPHQRLKWARLRAKFTTQKAAADALQMEEGTYSQYERAPGTSRWATLNHQLAIAAGRKYKVSWTWLLVGEGTPFDRPATEQQRRAIELMADLPEDKQDALVKAIEGFKGIAA